MTGGRTSKVPSRDRPRPLTSGHPLRAARNKVQTAATSAFGGHVFVLAWIGLYFLLFQLLHGQKLGGTTLPDVKGFWDTVLSRHAQLLSQSHWDAWRHLFRGGGEYYLAALAVQQFLYNPYAHSVRRLTSAGQVAWRLVLSLACAVPVFIVGGILVHDLQHWLSTGALAPSVGSHPSLASKLYADSWTTKFVAALAGVVGARRPMLPVFDYNLRYFAERRVARGKAVRFYHPPAYRALVGELAAVQGRARAAEMQAGRGAWVPAMLVGGSALVVALAAYGTYVIDHYAK